MSASEEFRMPTIVPTTISPHVPGLRAGSIRTSGPSKECRSWCVLWKIDVLHDINTSDLLLFLVYLRGFRLSKWTHHRQRKGGVARTASVLSVVRAPQPQTKSVTLDSV